jgi:pimeloyl-ACP methyl ester carboxylesterase
MERRFAHAFEGYALPGRWLHGGAEAECRMLAIHGARSDHTRLDPLLLRLQARGLSSLSFALSGHTVDSPVPNDRTSLAINLAESLAFAQLLGHRLEIVLGHSLGGALAMKVAQAHADSVHTLILSAPALYPEAAWSVPAYGPAFTQALSTPYGFLDSLSLPFLRRFKGKTVLVIGEYDGLRAELHGGIAGRSAGEIKSGAMQVYSPIPAEALEAIQQAAGDKLRLVVLRACDHKIYAHLLKYPQAADALADRLCSELASGPFRAPAWESGRQAEAAIEEAVPGGSRVTMGVLGDVEDSVDAVHGRLRIAP